MSEQHYECKECGLHYEDNEITKQCEAFCKAKNACNLEITQHSLENKQMQDKP